MILYSISSVKNKQTNKKCAPKLIFSMNKESKKVGMIFDVGN